ncbi:MAG: LysR substrate-binding domain-containing protein [Planctomycetota bacterium]
MMNEIVTIRQLEVFVQVARVGNLTRAAEQIYLTQSAASMSLKQLEQALDGPLFHRVGRGLALNDRGRTLLPRAEGILASLCELVELARNPDGTPAGKLVIGCSTSIGNYFFPERLKAFSDAHPRVEIALRVGNTEDIADLVRSREIDLGLVEGDLDAGDLQEEDWLRDELVIFAAPSHPLVRRKRVTAKELVRVQWIMREKGSGTRTTIEHALARKNLRLARVYEIGHTEAIKRAVEAGMGVSCLSRMTVERNLADGRLKQIPALLDVSRWFRIITIPGQHQSRLIQYVLRWLRSMRE